MRHSRITRRGFCVGCSAAIASLAGSRFNSLAFAAPGSWTNDEILVVCFCAAARTASTCWCRPAAPPTTASTTTRRGRRSASRRRRPASGPSARSRATSFGFHPAMAPLYDLYQADRLSIAMACGMAPTSAATSTR